MRVRKIGRGPKFAMHRFLYGNVEKQYGNFDRFRARGGMAEQREGRGGRREEQKMVEG